jgi:hypothetical protein
MCSFGPSGDERIIPGMEREVLERLVGEGLTIRQIGERTGRSATSVRHWLERHGLRTRRSWRRDRPTQRPVEAERHCRRHGRTRHVLRDGSSYRCTKCRAEQVAARRRRVKETLVLEAGGCCEVCGYGRYIGALQFHHRDPSQKKFGLSRQGVTRSLSAAREEARKCVLLCANCHAEVEGGVISATLEPPRNGAE